MFWKKREPKEPVCECISYGCMWVNVTDDTPDLPYKEAWMEKFAFDFYKNWDSLIRECPIHKREVRFEWPEDNND